MATKIHVRQVEHRSTLPQLHDAAKPTLKQLLPSVDEDLTPPFALRATSTPDLILNIGPGVVANSGTSRNRAFAPINKKTFTFTSGTVTFPASSGGAIVVTPGTNGTLTVSSGQYIKVLVQINELGQMSVKTGVEGASAALATLPEHDDGVLPIGYVVMQNLAGTIQSVTNGNIYQFPNDSASTAGTGTGIEKLILTTTGLIVVDGTGTIITKI